MRRQKRHPDQEPLFDLCGVCGHPYLGGHRGCWTALDRWVRLDNLDDWAGQPNRAIL